VPPEYKEIKQEKIKEGHFCSQSMTSQLLLSVLT